MFEPVNDDRTHEQATENVEQQDEHENGTEPEKKPKAGKPKPEKE